MNKQILLFGIFLVYIVSCTKDNDTPTESSSITYKDEAFTQIFRQKSGLIAADVAQSIPLGNNKSLWVFGDSYIDTYDIATQSVPCLFQVRNAATLVNNSNLSVESTLIGTGLPASYFKNNTDNSYWFWPNAGYQNGNFVYVFLGLIHATGTIGDFGFEVIDELFVAKINAIGLSEIEYINLGSKSNIIFNNAVIKDSDFVYIYGIRENGFGKDLFVARYPKDNLLADWEYRTTTNWSTDSNDAKKIHDEFTSSFHVTKINGKYILITTEFSVGCDQGSEIYSYTSDTPYGPFSNKKTIWTVDDTLDGHLPFFYQANAHPEYENGKDELLVTYCINGYGNCVNTCIDNRFNPDYYRPRAIRVPYEVMGIDE